MSLIFNNINTFCLIETIEISQESSSSTDRPSSRSDDASTDTNDAVDDIEDEKKVKPLRLSMKISDLKQQLVFRLYIYFRLLMKWLIIHN